MATSSLQPVDFAEPVNKIANFGLKVEPDKQLPVDEFYLEVKQAPAGGTDKERTRLAENLHVQAEAVMLRRDGRASCRDLGKDLYEFLFPVGNRNGSFVRWVASQKMLAPESTLRLHLDIRAPNLRRLPWELMFENGWPLALTQQSSIVRYDLEADASRPKALP
jgi:hypothetical protein